MTKAEEAALKAYPTPPSYVSNSPFGPFIPPPEDPQYQREIFVQGYEQAEKDILKIVSQINADLWGAPCNYSPLDEEICLCPNTRCDEICGTPEASDAECWKMYFNLKIAELNKEV